MSIFYIIAAGPSYMDVTEEEWKFLEDKHTITFARVPYGSRKTEYYMSVERDYIDKSVLTYMSKIGHTYTKLLLSIPQSINLARDLGFQSIRKIIKKTFFFMPTRSPWFVDQPEAPHKFIECRAKNFHQPLFRFRGQLTATINCALILGATEIRLIGVDLNDQKNFYQYEDILRNLCKDEETIEHYLNLDKESFESDMKIKAIKYPEFDMNSMHTTNIPYYEEQRWGKRGLRGIADVIQWMDKEMKEEGMDGIFTTNKDSLLFKENKLQYREIMYETN